MSRKGIPNKKGKIEYPRQCEVCGHTSNNPSAWHYHQRKHDAIPSGKLCDFGCGQEAKYKNTNNRYTCVENWANCPQYLIEHSERIREHWEGADDRKKRTRETLLKYVAGNPEVIEKQKRTLREKFGILTPEDARNYRHYARYIRKRSQQWAKEQGYELGRSTYHVDHKFSILDSWHANLSEEIVNHPVNLRVVSASENSGKGPQSLFTLDELLRLIEEYDA